MRLTEIETVTGTITLITGLHIGSGGGEMHIGGQDNPVIRNPLNNEPYIPGSSLKGKMRSLLEWRAGLAAVNGGGPVSYACYKRLCAEDQKVNALMILRLFGIAGGEDLDLEDATVVGPTRLSFWDCSMEPDWVKRTRERGQLLTETKMENSIDRVRGVADNPRSTERVPAGARFDFRLTMKQVNQEDLWETVWIGLKLLEMDSLGGSGSRGYGKIRFESLKRGEEDMRPYLDALHPFGEAA